MIEMMVFISLQENPGKQKKIFGIDEQSAKEILEVALSTGGDFAEVYMEETTNETASSVFSKSLMVSFALPTLTHINFQLK